MPTDEGQCCAHLRVAWKIKPTEGGHVTGWWECELCHTPFKPESLIRAAAQAAREERDEEWRAALKVTTWAGTAESATPEVCRALVENYAATARAQAFDEAAKVAEAHRIESVGVDTRTLHNNGACNQIASAIRALKEKGS